MRHMLFLFGLLFSLSIHGEAGTARVLTVNDAISLASADYLVRGIEHAAEEGVRLVVIEAVGCGDTIEQAAGDATALLADPGQHRQRQDQHHRISRAGRFSGAADDPKIGRVIL